MPELRTQLHPDVAHLIERFFMDEPFRLAAQKHPEQALAEYTLDDHERQALAKLLTNWDRLPAAIAELPQGGYSRFLCSRTLQRMLSPHE